MYNRNLAAIGLLAACALLVMLALAGAPALASEANPYLPSKSLIDVFAEGAATSGVVTDSRGDIYVSEYLLDKVTVYSPAGSMLTSFAVTAPIHFGPSGLAVDSAGEVYVQVYNRGVTKYKPSVYPPTAGTTYAIDKAAGTEGVIVANAAEAHAVAVDPANQDLYVATAKHISSYSPTGTLISSTIGESVVSGPEYYGLDVDGSTGNVYTVDRAHSSAYVLNPAGNAILAKVKFTSATTPNLFDLAVDQSSGDFFVMSSKPNEEGATSVVDEFNASGAYVTQLPREFGASLSLQGIPGPSDIAVDNGASSPNAGDIFVASRDEAHRSDSVYAFGPRTAAPIEEKLTVTSDGNGSGKHTCEVNGAFEECAGEYAQGTRIALRGSAEAGSVFEGWSAGTGAATSCTGTATCALTLSAETGLHATFLLEDTLALRTDGTGTGTVTSEPAGLSCGLTCEAVFSPGQTVTLTAAPVEGKVGGWTGCESISGPGGEKCVVTIAAAKLVTVQFDAEPLLTVVKEGTGAAEGRVISTPAGIDCGATCTLPVALGATILLEAQGEGASFGGWTGCTSEPEGKCEVLMSAAKQVKASFTAAAPADYVLKALVSGGGEIVAPPGTIACKEGGSSTQCEEEVASKAAVKLEAKPESGWVFEEWTEGPCAGAKTATCEFGMPAHEVKVAAKFAESHLQKLTVVKFGQGTVSSATAPGLTCGAGQLECAAEFELDTHVLLTETPAAGYEFAGWIGCKAKAASSCEFTASKDGEVAAIFLAEPPAGKEGPPGTTGATGAEGAAGPIGVPGETGATGAQGPPGSQGAIGPQGPAGAQGPAGHNGTVELVTCQLITVGGKKVKRCTVKQVTGPLKLGGASHAAKATLASRGVVYAVGTASRGGHRRLLLRLKPLRRLRPGRYMLTLIVGAGRHERIRRESYVIAPSRRSR